MASRRTLRARRVRQRECAPGARLRSADARPGGADRRAVRDRRRRRGSERADARPVGSGAMHGGPPAALLARAVEQCDPGPANFVARLTVELLRPVPLVPLTISARTLRPGKMVHWIEAILRAGDVEVARRRLAAADGRRLAGCGAADRRVSRSGSRHDDRSRSADGARCRVLERQRDPHGHRHVRRGRSRRRVAPVDRAARRGRGADSRATGRGGGRLRERRRQPARRDRRRRDQRRPHRRVAPTAARRVGRPRLARVGARAGHRHGRGRHPRPRRPRRPLRAEPARPQAEASRATTITRESDRVSGALAIGVSRFGPQSSLRSTSAAQSANSPLR